MVARDASFETRFLTASPTETGFLGKIVVLLARDPSFETRFLRASPTETGFLGKRNPVSHSVPR
ncbi:hypothetical protein [Microseira sp. BLCC-F43]|uniref:hypothetical protein n=1 Tax=Microseira sp. BLCC-F43 TaxID=3153602 RepID=UPI0035BB85A3